MAKYFDADGNELPNGHGYICPPRKTVQHDAVPAVAHHEHYDLAGDHALDWDVVDKPAVPAWGEVTEYTCTPIPEPEPAPVDDTPTIDKRMDEAEAAVIELAGLAADNAAGLTDTYSAITELGDLVAAESEDSNG